MHANARRVRVPDEVIGRFRCVLTFVVGQTEYRRRCNNVVVVRRVVDGRRRRRRRRCGRLDRLLIDLVAFLRLPSTSPPCEEKDQTNEK